MEKIKIFVMDVDGTLTDSKIYIGVKGETMKAFNVKDGYGIVMLHDNGIEPVIITGRQSEIVAQRAKELKITELHQGIHDKRKVLLKIMEDRGLTKDQVAYIGDDLNDAECFEVAGMTACPADSISQIKAVSAYVCTKNGGDGAVREFIDRILS